MTISIAWVRSAGGLEEMVVASDSRLSFGCRWDCAPKILAMPRGDSVMAFAGDTMYAYPIMTQAIHAIEQHEKLKSRALDLSRLKGHLLRVLNNMTSLIRDLPRGADGPPETTFIFGGYCWKKSAFKMWLLHYDGEINRFTFRPSSQWRGGNSNKVLTFAGDYETEFKERLVELLRKKEKLDNGGFDMEPFEVLRDMLRMGRYDLIGGAPQILKVYKHMNCRPYSVYWPNKESGSLTLLGRPLLPYEKADHIAIDPDTFERVM